MHNVKNFLNTLNRNLIEYFFGICIQSQSCCEIAVNIRKRNYHMQIGNKQLAIKYRFFFETNGYDLFRILFLTQSKMQNVNPLY